jgi:hypothetical protein
MRRALSNIDPNDPDYDTKATTAMRNAGVSPDKIASFRKDALAGQLQKANIDEKQALAAKTKQDTISKFNENQVKIAEQADDMVAAPLKDTLDTYHSILSKAGPNPSPEAKQTAMIAAQTIFRSHASAVLKELPDDSPMKKVISDEINKPFNIDEIESHYNQTQMAKSAYEKRKNELGLKKEQAEIGRTQADTAEKYAEIKHLKAETNKINTEIDAGPGGKGAGGREATMLGRQMNALGEGIKALENVSELPAGSSTSLLGNYDPGHSLLGTGKKALGDVLTTDDAKAYQIVTAGLSRAAAVMETSGLAPPGALAKQMHDALEIQPTDSRFVAMRKLAEARQVLEEPIKNLKVNPVLTKDQKKLISVYESRLQQAIPYTQHDLTEYENTGKRNESFGDYAKRKGLDKGEKPAVDSSSDPLGLK